MPMSELTGTEVASDSEAWRHECECRWVLDGMADREQRNAYLDGETDYAGKLTRKGVKHQRGEEAVERIRRDVYRLIELRRTRAPSANDDRQEAAA